MRDLGDELLRAKVNARLFGGAARDAHDGAPRLGRLVILDRLGAGAMGTVYAAYDPQLDRKVAVKVLHAAGADANARFLREARTLAKLAHPNIVTIYEAGEDAGAVHVVMELATGVPLRAWIAAAERKHDWRDVVRVMREVAAGLAAAHAAGIVHRDVKPENILIGDDRARLVDFGLALDDAERAGDEPVAGTPAYLAPEVLAGGAATAASDQFSFGVTLYEALYGKRPHAAATRAELADAARRAADAPAVDPAVPGWVHAIAKRALAAAPEDRAPSMTAVGSELGRDRRTKRRALAIAAAALVAGGIGGALVMHGSAAPTPAPPSCDGSSRTAEVWSRDRADHVRAALGDAGWRDRAIGSLDELARAWTASYGKVCEATRIRGAQSDRLLELRMRCLDRALGRFDALAAALAASPLDRAARAEASSAILQLPRPERCETIVDDGELALPDDPATRARAGEVEHELDRAWAAYGLGRYRDAKAIVDAVDPIASALDVPALRAQLLVVAGAIAGRIGDPASARGVLERALVAAARAHAPELELAVWSRLLRHELFAGVPQRTIEYSAFASAAAARAGRDGAELDGVVAEALLDAGQPAAARERIERALASHDPLRDDQRALLELDHGAIELAMGHAPKAEAALTRALELARGALGDEHPTLALYLDKLADAARARGKLRDALALHDRSVELRRRAFGDGDRAVATARFHRAETLLEAGQLTRAALDLDAAREIRQRAYGERSPRLGELEALAGELAAARGEIAAARAHYAAAAALDPRLELTALRLAAGERAPGGDVAITEPFSVDHVAALAARIAQLPPDHGQPLARTLLDRWRAAGPVDPALAIAVADALAATHADADAIATYRSALAALGDEPSRSRLQVLRVLVAMHAEPAATLAPLTAAMPELR